MEVWEAHEAVKRFALMEVGVEVISLLLLVGRVEEEGGGVGGGEEVVGAAKAEEVRGWILLEGGELRVEVGEAERHGVGRGGIATSASASAAVEVAAEGGKACWEAGVFLGQGVTECPMGDEAVSPARFLKYNETMLVLVVLLTK